MVERLATRTNNSYGKHSDELAKVLGYLATVEPLVRRGASAEIDTSASVAEVIKTILANLRPVEMLVPVLVPSALLSIGDVQVAQGDGEVTDSSIGIDATVTVKVGLLKGRQFRQPAPCTSDAPLVVPGPHDVATGHELDLGDAARADTSGSLYPRQRSRGPEDQPDCGRPELDGFRASAVGNLRELQRADASLTQERPWIPPPTATPAHRGRTGRRCAVSASHAPLPRQPRPEAADRVR